MNTSNPLNVVLRNKSPSTRRELSTYYYGIAAPTVVSHPHPSLAVTHFTSFFVLVCHCLGEQRNLARTLMRNSCCKFSGASMWSIRRFMTFFLLKYLYNPRDVKRAGVCPWIWRFYEAYNGQ